MLAYYYLHITVTTPGCFVKIHHTQYHLQEFNNIMPSATSPAVQPLSFVIGMEIIVDRGLEEAMDGCSIFDASDADCLSFRHSRPEDDANSDVSGFTLASEEEDDSDDEESASSEEASVERAADDDLMMARLAGAYLSAEDSDSDSDSDSDGCSLSMASRLDTSANTSIAVMLDVSRSSQGLMSSLRRDGSGTGRSRRTKGSLRRLSSQSTSLVQPTSTAATTTVLQSTLVA